MALPLLAIAGSALVWLGRAGMAAFAINEVKNLTTSQKSTIETASAQASAAGISETEQKKMVAATTFEQVEKEGKDVDEWWGKLTPQEQELLQFSPESLRSDMQRTTFLGIAQTLAWLAAGVAGGIAAFRGLPVTLRGLSKIASARSKGANAAELMTIIEETKMGVLAKAWVPGFTAGIAAAGGWLTGGLANNLNDATLWGRIFLDQAHQDVMKAAANAAKGESSGSGSGVADSGTKTIIRMTEETKPKQFIGTLFSAKLGNVAHFERAVNDEINDMNELLDDAKTNLNRWLKSLPNRLGYSVKVVLNPVDEFGTQQSGIWAVLTLFITHISGKISPIDTILLGPVAPQTRFEIQKNQKTIENEIKDSVSAMTVNEIQVPVGSVDIFSATGERIGMTETPTKSAAEAERKPGETEAEQRERLEKTARDLQKQVDFLKENPTARKINSEDDAASGSDVKRVGGQLFEIPKSSGGSGSGGNSGGSSRLSPGTYFVNTGGSNLNVRGRYGTSGVIIGKFADGTKVELEGDGIQSDGYTWYNVRGQGIGASISGWVASEFLRR